MARVTYGAIITELKGSIGNTTFQNNVSGNIMKSKSGSRNTNSHPQIVSQQLLSAINNLWLNLNSVEKQSWLTFASTYNYVSPYGITKILSGYQYFVSCNSNILLLSGTHLTMAPGYISIPNFPIFTFLVDEFTFNLEIDAPVTLADSYIAVYATSLSRSGNLNTRKNYKLILSLANNTTTEIVLIASYQNSFSISWSDIVNNSRSSIVVSCKFIEKLTGLAGIYYTNVINFPLP
jgi:hypothetical protein